MGSQETSYLTLGLQIIIRHRSQNLWVLPAKGYGSSVIGYHGFIGFDIQFTADQVGGQVKLSVIWGYGLSEV